jgi:hypothetical protein
MKKHTHLTDNAALNQALVNAVHMAEKGEPFNPSYWRVGSESKGLHAITELIAAHLTSSLRLNSTPMPCIRETFPSFLWKFLDLSGSEARDFEKNRGEILRFIILSDFFWVIDGCFWVKTTFRDVGGSIDSFYAGLPGSPEDQFATFRVPGHNLADYLNQQIGKAVKLGMLKG